MQYPDTAGQDFWPAVGRFVHLPTGERQSIRGVIPVVPQNLAHLLQSANTARHLSAPGENRIRRACRQNPPVLISRDSSA